MAHLRLTIVCAALAMAGVVVSAQEATFRGAVRTVAVYATVSDADGRLVPDLTRGDFSILDNGTRQDLTLFANDVQPITVVMLLDRSGSMKANFSLVQQAAARFVDVMLPADKARIGSFSNRIEVDPRDFTSDHDELHGILDHDLQEEGPTPLWNAVNVGITALLHQQGRRVILVFTDGHDEPFPGQSNNSLKDVMKRAEEEDVMVYAIGLSGSSGAGGRRPGGGRRGFGGGGFGGFGGGGFGGRARAADKPDEGLPKIAAATGGGYFELTSTHDLAETFARVADELHHQYALGFTPGTLDGKMHALDVKVGGEGRRVRARTRYLARPSAGGS
ncbi:MAG TPA: VWA domain-containing protein [Vicinamibacterales bacterium]|nr:VWA domain-containing protein [Vicinamibacterales bacterium]